MISRPRGRARKGCEWNERLGKWISVTTGKEVIRGIQKKEREWRVVCAPAPFTQQKFHHVNLDSADDFVEYEPTAEEIQQKAIEDMQRKEDALKLYELMGPYRIATEIHNNYQRYGNKNVHVYWLDKNYDFFQCPQNPYTQFNDSKVPCDSFNL